MAFRDLGKNDISRWLRGAVMPGAENPAAHFSADLCFASLGCPVSNGALSLGGRSVGEGNGADRAYCALGRAWHASGGGCSHAMFQHAGLAQLFAERALERADTTCLAIPAVHSLLRSKLGSYAVELSHGLLPTVIAS